MADESGTHDDLLVGDFSDTYLNLTLKTVMGIEWAADLGRRDHPCVFLFTDDDVFVSIQWLARYKLV